VVVNGSENVFELSVTVKVGAAMNGLPASGGGGDSDKINRVTADVAT
jgi:hypothetical protein